jgi:hypothetical protein
MGIVAPSGAKVLHERTSRPLPKRGGTLQTCNICFRKIKVLITPKLRRATHAAEGGPAPFAHAQRVTVHGDVIGPLRRLS